MDATWLRLVKVNVIIIINQFNYLHYLFHIFINSILLILFRYKIHSIINLDDHIELKCLMKSDV